MPKKSKNKVNFEQTHGMDESAPITLDQIWGDTGSAKFQTLDETEYNNRLQEMNLSDLQAEAYRIGLIPIHNREQLTSRLMREFRRHCSEYSNSTIKKINSRSSVEDFDSVKNKKVRQIMSS